MDLMARVTMGTVRARHQQEARGAATFHEAAVARAEADALDDLEGQADSTVSPPRHKPHPNLGRVCITADAAVKMRRVAGALFP
jgi:hypothetical protein